MTIENAIISNKSVSNRLRGIQKGLGILLALLIVFPIGYCIWPFVIPEIVGSISVSQQKYPNANLIYSGYRITGSSSWQLKSFIYWTNDSVENVKAYYEKQFDIKGTTFPVYKGATVSEFTGHSDRLAITFADANQNDLSYILDHSYSEDPYTKIKNLPRTGTVIVLTHDIFAP